MNAWKTRLPHTIRPAKPPRHTHREICVAASRRVDQPSPLVKRPRVICTKNPWM